MFIELGIEHVDIVESVYIMYLHMETTIRKWGNSLAVRLPKQVVKKLSLHEGVRVAVREQEREVIITQTPNASLSLKERLKLVTAKNLHRETDWGPARGKEI